VVHSPIPRSLAATGSSSLAQACGTDGRGTAPGVGPLLVVENCTLGLPDEGEYQRGISDIGWVCIAILHWGGLMKVGGVAGTLSLHGLNKVLLHLRLGGPPMRGSSWCLVRSLVLWSCMAPCHAQLPLVLTMFDMYHIVFARPQSFSTGCASSSSLPQISRPTLVGLLLSAFVMPDQHQHNTSHCGFASMMA
jgi:hypothetical protein